MDVKACMRVMPGLGEVDLSTSKVAIRMNTDQYERFVDFVRYNGRQVQGSEGHEVVFVMEYSLGSVTAIGWERYEEYNDESEEG